MPNIQAKSKAPAPPTLESVLSQNVLLARASQATKTAICSEGVVEHLSLRQTIYDPDEIIAAVYFPIDCVLSIVATMRDGNQIEIGTIGREGFSAFPLMLDGSTLANLSYCQVKGNAIRIPTALFHTVLANDPDFRALVNRYVQTYVNLLGQLAACNQLHSIYQRCARWLLLTHDRVGSDVIALTQEFLAMMLGTGRSGVTIAASTMQKAGFIKYTHGSITVIDRPGLESAACECYEIASRQFAGLSSPAVSATRDAAVTEPAPEPAPDVPTV